MQAVPESWLMSMVFSLNVELHRQDGVFGFCVHARSSQKPQSDSFWSHFCAWPQILFFTSFVMGQRIDPRNEHSWGWGGHSGNSAWLSEKYSIFDRRTILYYYFIYVQPSLRAELLPAAGSTGKSVSETPSPGRGCRAEHPHPCVNGCWINGCSPSGAALFPGKEQAGKSGSGARKFASSRQVKPHINITLHHVPKYYWK